MKIAVFGYAHPFGPKASKYGAEREVWYLADEFVKRGHQVTIFSVKAVQAAVLLKMPIWMILSTNIKKL